MNALKNVTVIPATVDLHTRVPKDQKVKRRVAGYARVSTDSEEQLTSYEAQVDYYTRTIKENPTWEFIGVYTDEGISALNTKKRDGFNQMIEDALHGLIDLIITKSVSRFARNTVDSLTTVRKLKDKGVEVYFEKENIWTLDSKGELLITIMSSLAQEESRSISENVTWGQRKRFADGKVNIPYGQFLGYRKGSDGLPEIVPEEAKTVRLIYRLFIEGETPNAIARHLTESGIPTPGGKRVWQYSTVESILTNEKYKGAALLQKKFTVDFLQKRVKVNEGEVPQYFVEHSHKAIIDPVEWGLVQAEMRRRKSLGERYSFNSLFSTKIICGTCGCFYSSKTWHSTDKYRRVIWQCGAKYHNEHPCRTPHLYEKDIQEKFLSAFSKLMANRENILEDCRIIQATLTDCSGINEKIAALNNETDVIAGLIQKCVDENASDTLDQTEFSERYNGYIEKFESLNEQKEALKNQRNDRMAKNTLISEFMSEISEMDTLPIQFDERLWTAVVDHVTVYEDERLVFTFKNGVEITEKM